VLKRVAVALVLCLVAACGPANATTTQTRARLLPWPTATGRVVYRARGIGGDKLVRFSNKRKRLLTYTFACKGPGELKIGLNGHQVLPHCSLGVTAAIKLSVDKGVVRHITRFHIVAPRHVKWLVQVETQRRARSST
jgi:hypothetical protein